MKYEIWQLKNNDEIIRNFGFRRYESVIKRYGKIDKLNYEKVYEIEGEYNSADCIEYLDDLFIDLNCNRPSDFKGHSLSVSDVVVVDGNAYYCDSFGWQKIEF